MYATITQSTEAVRRTFSEKGGMSTFSRYYFHHFPHNQTITVLAYPEMEVRSQGPQGPVY